MGQQCSTSPSARSEGDEIPTDIIFHMRVREKDSPSLRTSLSWKHIPCVELFSGKRIVVIYLKGAFFAKCSHMLQDYDRAYDLLLKLGIDDVFCLAGNDSFVMRQWGLLLQLPEEKISNLLYTTAVNPGNFRNVKLIPDGSHEFSRKMRTGVTIDSKGFGERSTRFSMVVNNLKIEKLFVEVKLHTARPIFLCSINDPTILHTPTLQDDDNDSPHAASKSSADVTTMLKYLRGHVIACKF